MTAGIYEILNTANGKRYIGSAANIKRRFSSHRHMLKRGGHHSIALQRAWDKHGAETFKFIPILTCAPTRQMLEFYEQQLLDKARPEYNIATVANSQRGVTHTPEARARMSAGKIGNTNARGFKHSAETRAKASAALLGNKRTAGHVLSSEHKKKLAAASMGNTHARGMRHTAETRAKISAAHTGKIVSAETRERMSVAGRARWARR